MADETSESGRETHPSIDLTLYQIRELQAAVEDLKEKNEELSRAVDRMQDRMKLVATIVVVLTPALWKLVDKIWP